MSFDFEHARPMAFSAKRLASVDGLFAHRAALFFTPTENVPPDQVGSGVLDVTIPWVIPNATTYYNNRAFQMPRLWVDALQRATGKVRWRPVNPAKVTVFAYDDMSDMDIAIGAKPLIDALKVSTYGRRDGKRLHYFGAIEDDSPRHIALEWVVDTTQASKAGATRIIVESLEDGFERRATAVNRIAANARIAKP